MAVRQNYDVVVLGAGAAGLMCARTAASRGRRVLLLEVSNKPGKKILMSGGGRCNFTNLDIEPDNFICDNPHFVKSALSQYTQWDFIGLVARHGIAYHEKTHGQLFCDNSSKDILNMLLTECREAGVEIQTKIDITQVTHDKANGRFDLQKSVGGYTCQSLVVATGGLSIPTLGGATGFGYRLARQFGLSVSTTEASLVPMTLSGQWHAFAKELSGVAIPVSVSVPERGFNESLLFTHRGISGPAILQLSNYWQLGEPIYIDLLPDETVVDILLGLKQDKGKTTITSVLNTRLPKSLVIALQAVWWPDYVHAPIQEISNQELERIAHQINEWELKPSGTEGYRTAEVTRGGVDVDQVSSQTMQVNDIDGLYMIGEVLDVVGHLGGYNFQWAWSSGYAAGCRV